MDDRDLRADLDDLLAAHRLADRGRARAAARQLADGASFVGTMVDLAEAEATVVVRTRSGRAHAGPIAFVGADFVAVGSNPAVLVRCTAITSVTVHELVPAARGERGGADVLLVEALARWADERTVVTVVTVGDQVAGELEAVGRDVLTIRVHGGTRRAYLLADSVAEVLRSG